MKIYACGGAGSNIARMLDNLVLRVVYVDTSKSNLKDSISADQFFKVEGMDGAGKYQRSANEGFRDLDEDVLITHKPDE